jgi:mannitol/fructose-specific phosphotransferase system IIA component (Ntr-type)
MLPSGRSVPHARLRDDAGFVLALGIPADPLFHEEGLQIRMMALMISNQSGTPWYLPALAALTKISRNGEFFPRLCGAENPEDFLRMLREQDQELD